MANFYAYGNITKTLSADDGDYLKAVKHLNNKLFVEIGVDDRTIKNCTRK